MTITIPGAASAVTGAPHARPTAPRGGARFLVPAYFNPEWAAADWQALAALGPRLAFAVLNPDSGPGNAVDRRYLEPVAAVEAAGGSVIGYVDTGYGRRPAAQVLRDLAAYRSWYGLRGGFLDQVASGREHLAHYRRLASAARRIGLDFLALNPGVTPDPGYADLADVTVTFEGPWDAYRDHVVADWVRGRPAERFCHLVHSTPRAELASVRDGARSRHAGAVYATELTGANPWGSLSAQLRRAAAAY
jgi:hypothetical protein